MQNLCKWIKNRPTLLSSRNNFALQQDGALSHWWEHTVALLISLSYQQGRAQDFWFWVKTEGQKAEIEDGGSCEGATTLPLATGAWGSAISCPSGVRVITPTAQSFFSIVSALRMATSDTIVLLIVNCHAAVGGQDLCDPLVNAPGHLTDTI